MNVFWEALAILLIAAVGTWLLDRQLEREEQERRRREWLASSPQAQAIHKAFAEMQGQIGEQLLPAVQQVAVAIQKFARAFESKGDA